MPRKHCRPSLSSGPYVLSAHALSSSATDIIAFLSDGIYFTGMLCACFGFGLKYETVDDVTDHCVCHFAFELFALHTQLAVGGNLAFLSIRLFQHSPHH